MQNDSDAEDVSHPPLCGCPSSQEPISGAGRVLSDVAGYTELNRAKRDELWKHFSSKDDFNSASWLVRSQVAKSQRDAYFAQALGCTESSDSGPPIPCDNTPTFWSHLVSTWYGRKLLSMMVEMLLHCIIRILSTVSASSLTRSRIDPIWSTHLFRNMIRVGSEYILRCIRRTGGGIHRYEIGLDKFQVAGV